MKLKKNLMKTVLAIGFISILSPLSLAGEAESFSAFINEGVLYVTTITDDCNAYHSSMGRTWTCLPSKDKMCRPDKEIADISILVKTRKGCSGEKGSVFSFEVGEKPENTDYLNVNLNGKSSLAVKW